MMLDQSSQVLHCLMEPVNDESSFFCSFIYVVVHIMDRRSLWKALHKHKLAVKDRPWVILGDFNACLDLSERSSGCSKVTTAMNDFRDCVSDIEVEDIAMSGLRFTWNKKLGVEEVFVIPEVKKLKPKSFKFHNYFLSKDAFIPTVSGVWSNKVDGFSMFSLVSNVKMLKRPLRKLNYDQGNLVENVRRLRSELAIAQTSLCADRHNRLLREVEAKTFKAYKLNRNKISYVEDMNGNAFHGLDVGEQFVLHFKSVLGMSFKVSPIADPGSLFTKFLLESEAFHMIRAVSDDEIKNCAFIPSRQISDNILLSQELMRGYHRDREFGFHQTMIKWIMSYVTSPSFSINVNGDHIGYFKGMRGLRQGDPLSPYLFTLVMEVFNLVLKRQISKSPSFKYHWLCKDLKLTQLCFNDDLLLFCHGDSKSATVFKEALDEFGGMSGLLPSKIKSVVFFSNFKQAGRNNILKIMPFQVGILPVRYLRVPLISKRLYIKDCQLLIDKVKKRVFDWKNKVLSFAGRLQLVQSVLSSMQVFWSSIFILPKTIAYEIERLMRDFVWNYGEFKRGKAKVNWDVVCKPKVEGGVFWDILEKAGACWAWKNLLRFRPLFRDHIIHRIGDGLSTSLWYDNWHAICPLSNFISKREILHSGLSLNCKVADVINDGKWDWPTELVGKYDSLSVISPPFLVENKPDKQISGGEIHLMSAPDLVMGTAYAKGLYGLVIWKPAGDLGLVGWVGPGLKCSFISIVIKGLEHCYGLNDKRFYGVLMKTLKNYVGHGRKSLKMKDKMIQLDYEKLNSLYEVFVPQTESPIEQTYLSTPSTFNVPSESSIETSDLPVKKRPNESKLLQLFVKLDKSIGDLQTKIDQTLLKDRSRALVFDNQDVLRQFYKTGVTLMSISLRRCSNEIKQEIREEKNKMLMLEKETLSNDSKDIQATIEQRIKILENDFKRAEIQYVKLELKMQHQKEKMACDVSWKSKMTKFIKATRVQHQQEVNELVENVNQKTYAHGEVRVKNQDLLMTIFALKAKLVEQANNVNTKFDKSATLEKPVYVTSLNKNKDLKANKVSKVMQIVLWIVDSGCSKHMTGNLKLLRNFVKKFMGTVRFGNDNFTTITGYGDYVQGYLTICHVYYVEGLGHNLFLVEQFCDGDLEVAFR
ncbi:putative reverse transcriptase domain-containing protein [Tanacetum coccineum]